jgi:putative ABC transport system substrate-binding protein
MRRRHFVALLASTAMAVGGAWPHRARAQRAAKVPQIGFLSGASATARSTDRFLKGLRELGYVDGSTIAIHFRFAEGRFDRLGALAAELVSLKVDVIVALVTQASLAAKKATDTIPIVMAAVSDPLTSGLVASLARPGGNITGTSSMSAEVLGKALEVFKEAFPGIARVAVLWNPDNALFEGQMLREAEGAAGALGIRLLTFGARNAVELDEAFAAIAKHNADALLTLGDPILNLHAARIAKFAERGRLPAMYSGREQVAAGGLMSYGPDIAEQFRRAAIYVDKILKGAKPGELPIEQPTKFELIVNLKAAKALGVALPPTLLARADEVIE